MAQQARPAGLKHEPSTLPLSGIRILDVASFIAAPVAATVLGDYGADVIKVEPLGEGDPNRTIAVVASGYPKSPVNYPWHLDSRGKRSLAIDLKHEQARAAFDRVIATADVLITNYPLASRRRLRLDYEAVASVNPRLIYASFTGYGETGPDADQVGFDTTAYFARSGIMDGARYDDAVPGVTMPAQGDRAAAMALAAAIMIALWNRERTGKGTKVSSSLLANGIWANGNAVQAALVGAPLPKRPPPDRPRSALANVYRTKDGRWFQLTLVREDRDWPGVCRALGREDLMEDPRFTDMPKRRANGAPLAAILGDAFATRDFAEWRTRLKAQALPFAPISRAEDLVEDEQAAAAGIIVPTTHTEMPHTLATPFSLSDVPLPPPGPGPSLGAHSDEILCEAGLSPEEIADMRASGALG
ncbi:MAG TPA: CaiB/BaiF CoA-transferase family protein [Hyphomicrobiaceae bacterium]|nr:CaiB/BaiF CoA-transferase family protein [Hyphomicrobiaceae bacterium]